MAENRSLRTAGLCLGIGLGGFVDGIVFHQLLQFHHMLSAKFPPTSIVNMEINMFWDGLFHMFTWIMTVVGIVILWRAGKQRHLNWNGWVLLGSSVVGWGVFNMVEGVVDHYILGIHHVVESQGRSLYDFLFLISGVVMAVVGSAMVFRGMRSPGPPIVP